MSRRGCIASLVVLAMVLSGCAAGIGQSCGECPRGLICSRPVLGDGGVAESGICDYPLRGEGEPCDRADHCETTLTCSSHFEPSARYGVCVVRRSQGESCFLDRDCATGKCAGATAAGVDGICG